MALNSNRKIKLERNSRAVYTRKRIIAATY